MAVLNLAYLSYQLQDMEEDVIHIGSQDQYNKEDDFYRDLAEGLIRSTRQKEARNTKYNVLVKEELISLVGANMLGQENRFNVTVPQQSAIWKKRLPKVKVSETARYIIVEGSSFKYVYSKLKGVFEQLSVAGKEILEKPMEVNIWRAPTDNDMYIKLEWMKVKWGALNFSRVFRKRFGSMLFYSLSQNKVAEKVER